MTVMRAANRFRDWLLRPVTDRMDRERQEAEERAAEVRRQALHAQNFSHRAVTVVNSPAALTAAGRTAELLLRQI